jgi:hypothetical protein
MPDRIPVGPVPPFATPEQREAMRDLREGALVANTIIENFKASEMTPTLAMLTIVNLTLAYITTCPDPKVALEQYKSALDIGLDMHAKLVEYEKSKRDGQQPA